MRNMTVSFLAVLTIVAVERVDAQGSVPDFRVMQVAPGVITIGEEHRFLQTVHGNSTFIIDDAGVIMVDASQTPAAAERMLEMLKQHTTKPIRTLLFTHWHMDHIWGAQSVVRAFPSVEIVAHDSTRIDLMEKVVGHARAQEAQYRQLTEQLRQATDRGTTTSGTPLNDWTKSVAKRQLHDLDKYVLPELSKVDPPAPTRSFEKKLSYNNGRAVEFLYFGRGNTRGDAIVHLPAEGIVIMGDLLVHPIPYPFGSFIGDWISTLDSVIALNPRVIVPGHGPVLRDQNYLRQVRSFLKDLHTQVAAIAPTQTLQQVQSAVTMAEWKQRFTNGDPRYDADYANTVLAAVTQAYRELRPAK